MNIICLSMPKEVANYPALTEIVIEILRKMVCNYLTTDNRLIKIIL